MMKMSTRHKYNTSFFLKEDSNSFYLLGLFITDGNVFLKKGNETTIKSIDQDLLLTILNKVCPTKSLYKVKESNCYKLSINNKDIVDWLLKYGCVPNKTKVVKFPKIKEEYIPDLMRGLIDGDGSIGTYSKRAIIRFDSASIDLISGFVDILSKWNIYTKITKTPWIKTSINGKIVKSTTQMYRVNINGINAYKLLKIIYNNDNLSLNRKRIKANEIITDFESKGFSSSELMTFNIMPYKKWASDEELVNCVLKHQGILVKAAKELNLVPETLSRRLRKINKYDYIRSIFPIRNINNLTSKRELKLSNNLIQEIYQLIDNKVSYREIANKFSIKESYVAFLKRRRNLKN